MKVESGNLYRTRDGRKIGPMISHWNDEWPWTIAKSQFFWNCSGDACIVTPVREFVPGLDIIAEWTDEPVVETVTLYGSNVTWTPTQVDSDTHILTLPINDGFAITGTFTNENGDTIKVEKIR